MHRVNYSHANLYPTSTNFIKRLLPLVSMIWEHNILQHLYVIIKIIWTNKTAMQYPRFKIVIHKTHHPGVLTANKTNIPWRAKKPPMAKKKFLLIKRNQCWILIIIIVNTYQIEETYGPYILGFSSGVLRSNVWNSTRSKVTVSNVGLDFPCIQGIWSSG